MTEELRLAPVRAKQLLKRFVPRRLWTFLRHAKKDGQGLAGRTLIGAAAQVVGPAQTLCMLYESLAFTPELVIQGYTQGLFPSAIHESGTMRWHDPDPRGILPIEDYHVKKTLKRTIRQGGFEVRVDHDFHGTLLGCAAPKPGRETTFITPQVIDVYMALHEMGVAHSVETYQDGALVGGLYGVAIGGYFAGESQFHRVSEAGQVAVVYLLELLRQRGFALHDIWWGSSHMETFGATYLPREEFKRRLARALTAPATFGPLEGTPFAERF